MTQDEALKLALEALEGLFGIPKQLTGEGGGAVATWRMGGSDAARRAIAALREALAQPVQEPLTDEQIIDAMHEDGCERIENFYVVGPVQKAAVFSFARAIEAKVKEKNT